MGVIELFVIIVIIGFVVFAIHRWAPIPPAFKTAVLWIGIIVVVLLALNAFGILGKDVAIPKIR